MSEQAVKRYWPEEIVGTGELVVYAQDYDALQSRIDAEQVRAAKLATKCVTLVNEAAHLRQQLSERNATLRDIRRYGAMGLEHGLNAQIDALLSSAEPVKAEFCCKHSYKAAKQEAWSARRIDRCKCDHNEYCEHCWPDDFREGGKWHGRFETKQSAPERGDGWIPVSERLPAVAQEVIVDSEFDGVTAGFLDSYGEWYSPNSDYKLTRVVAWQPLPAAPSLPATHRSKPPAAMGNGVPAGGAQP